MNDLPAFSLTDTELFILNQWLIAQCWTLSTSVTVKPDILPFISKSPSTGSLSLITNHLKPCKSSRDRLIFQAVSWKWLWSRNAGSKYKWLEKCVCEFYLIPQLSYIPVCNQILRETSEKKNFRSATLIKILSIIQLSLSQSDIYLDFKITSSKTPYKEKVIRGCRWWVEDSSESHSPRGKALSL